MAVAAITPVTVLTGFLGSGKSTLVNRIVADPRFTDTAVVVNEWGEVRIEHTLLRTGGETAVPLAGACPCCRVSGDVVRALRELHFQRLLGSVPHFSQAIIETSGLADPAPLLATLTEMPLVAARYALAGVVTVVDAVNGMATFDSWQESVKQVAVADRLVVSKSDLVTEVTLAALEARLRALNPGAYLLRSRGADLDAARVMDAGIFPADHGSDSKAWLNAGAYRPAGMAPVRGRDPRIGAFAWSAQEPLRWKDVESTVEKLLQMHGERVLRLKGLVHVAGEPGPRAIHAVQHTLYPSARLASWPDADRATRIVIVGRDLDEHEVIQLFDSSLCAPLPRSPWQPPRLPTRT